MRTLLSALSAPALLEGTAGALRWEGLQYERRYRRLLAPPLQRLLTQPGGRTLVHRPTHGASVPSSFFVQVVQCGLASSEQVADKAVINSVWELSLISLCVSRRIAGPGRCALGVAVSAVPVPWRAGVAALGRGCAAMPAGQADALGAREALMQLASEAVRVAAQSPFLEAAAGRAAAVLCTLYLPPERRAGAPGARASMPGAAAELAAAACIAAEWGDWLTVHLDGPATFSV